MQSNQPPPVTAQQQSVILQLQQAAQQSQSTTNGGVTTSQKHLGDGDDQYRNAKRRKPTSLSLPTRFTPSTLNPGPTDQTLSSSLKSLDSLSSSYRTLQSLEHKLDWTFSRKSIELQEPRSRENELGERRDRRLRVWVEGKCRDQEWQFNNQDEFKEAGEVAKEGQGNEVRTPRVEFEIKGKVLDDESQSTIPFTSHFQQIQISSPLLPSPLTFTRSSTTHPSSLKFTLPLSCPPTLSIPLTLTLHPYTFNSTLFTLLPSELNQLLQLSECTRSELIHNLWSYIRSKKLIIEGGIKVEEEVSGKGGGGGLGKKFFGGSEVVGWHHLGEYSNRWLGPVVPRKLECEFKVGENEKLEQLQAFDIPISTFPSSSTSSRPRLQLSQLLSSLSPQSPNPSPITHSISSLNSQIASSSLSTQSHLLQLHSLLSFTRSPSQFLETYLSSVGSDLSLVLHKEGRGGGDSMGLGEGWKESLRNTREFLGASGGEGEGEREEDGWIKEAVSVLIAREQEGRLRAVGGGGGGQMGGIGGGGQQVSLNPQGQGGRR